VAPGFDRAKTTVYERGIKVPLIVAGGCTVGGRVSDKLVGAVDIYATVIEALGYPVPATSGGYPVASKSFLKILTNDPTHVERDYLFTGARWGSPETELAAISKEKLKLRQYDATGDFVIDQEELFDLVLDPNEQVNLVNDPAYLSDLNILRAYITGSVLP
jgi:arylsulfatase A-like enzyme